MTNYSALAIANYFLSNYMDTGISPLKLQKLTYLAHGWHLALFNKPLVSDEYSEAWRHGPIFPSVYHEFKYRRNSPIMKLGKEPEFDEKYKFNKDGTFVMKTPEIEKDDEKTKELLDRVWEIYGDWTGSQLSVLCHKPGTPWEKTWKKNKKLKNGNIPNDIIRKYYMKKFKDQHKQ